MVCRKCGAILRNGDSYCPVCGAQAAVPGASASQVLVWGILGLVFGCSGALGLVGTVLSIIGIRKAKACQRQSMAPLTGKARVGQILSYVGAVVGVLSFIQYVAVMIWMFDFMEKFFFEFFPVLFEQSHV